MSPRAAWRLETLGFTDVYDYAAGKTDWTAAGLDAEPASPDTVARVARPDAPTCGLDDRVGEVRAALDASGRPYAVVVNDDRIVLGRLGRTTPEADDDSRVGDVMHEGPSTFRPDVPLHEMQEYMRKHDLSTAIITTSDGVLVGVARRADVESAHG